MTLDKYGLISLDIVNKTTHQSSTLDNFVSSLANDGDAMLTDFMSFGKCSVTQKETVSF